MWEFSVGDVGDRQEIRMKPYASYEQFMADLRRLAELRRAMDQLQEEMQRRLEATTPG